MAERDQVRRALGRHDARGARHSEHVALGELARADGGEGGRLHLEGDAGGRLPDGLRLGGDVHHSRLTRGGQVREAAEPGHIPRRAHRSGAGPDSDVGRGARVPEETLHPVFRDEFELLELAHTPLLIRREETAAIQVGQLDLVSAVFVAELAEIVVFSGETFDERFRVGHADLLTKLFRLLRAPSLPASVSALYSRALRAVKAWRGAADEPRWP